MPDEDDELLPAGRIGRFTVLREVGAGRTGRVYAAYDPHLDRRVAVKILSRGENTQQRLAEAQALAGVSHPNIVAVHDVGQTDGRVFIAMEYIEGETLHRWCSAEVRPFAETLKRLTQAGRGLAAAHREGLLRGDFKSSDVLCGADDRVRILDVGDVAAFCTTAWNVLYGQPPPDVPSDHGVPPWVEPMLRRSWSSMDELVHALEAHQRESRPASRRVALWLGAAAAGAAITVASIAALRGEDKPCDDAKAQLTEAWSDERREAIAEAFANSDVAIAAESWERVQPRLDDYADRWVAGYADACEATLVRGEQTATMMDLRIACLDARRRELAAVAEVLSEPTRKAIQRSVLLSAGLPAIESCSDPVYVLAEVKPPSDSHQAARVDALRERLALAKARTAAAALQDAQDELDALAPTARRAGYTPLVAEVDILHAELAFHRGERELAEELAAQAYEAARTTGHNVVAQRASMVLLEVIASRRDVEAAKSWSIVARAESTRLGGRERAAVVDDALGDAHGQALRFAEAKAYFKRALATLPEDDDDPRLRANAMADLGGVEARLGNHARARELLEASTAVSARVRGPSHPSVALNLLSIGQLDAIVGDYDGALRNQGRALQIAKAAYGDVHPFIAVVHHSIGGVHRLRNDLTATVESFEQSVAVYDAIAPQNPAALGVLVSLGKALTSLERYDEAERIIERALHLAKDARGGIEPSAPAIAMGFLKQKRGDFAGAIAAQRDALARREQDLGPDDVNVVVALWALSQALKGAGECEEALTHTARARALLDKTPSPLHTAEIVEIQIKCLAELGRLEETRRVAQQAIDAKAINRTDEPGLLRTWAQIERDARRPKRAAELEARAEEIEAE